MNFNSINRISLNLFDCVLAINHTSSEVHVSNLGYVIDHTAMYAKDQIVSHYKAKALDGEQLNKTFHKSWGKIANMSDTERYMHQMQHYLSTYGTDFEGEVYIPYERLDIPELEGGLTFKVIKAVEPNALLQKCLDLLGGLALKEETVKSVVELMGLLNFATSTLKGADIKNKEAQILIADNLGVLPTDTASFMRYLIFKSTDTTLLIKSNDVIAAIKSSSFNPNELLIQFGLDKLAQSFNRFKPLFLAFKSKGTKETKSTINKIGKLSKKLHVPMVSNPLNEVTSRKLSVSEGHWLENATIYAIFKAINACRRRVYSDVLDFSYNIRSGKSYTTSKEKVNKEVCQYNLVVLMSYLRTNYNMEGKTFLLDQNVEYALPTSEKLYAGNVPFGTKITSERIAAGVYWRNEDGASDLDLSGINLHGKIGWNSEFKSSNKNLMYSGDMTNASPCAVEYLRAGAEAAVPTLITVNVYSGEPTCGYNLIVGSMEDNLERDYMMDPNNLILNEKVNAVQKHMICGMLRPVSEKLMEYTVFNYGAGNARVSDASELANKALASLVADIDTAVTFTELVKELNGSITFDVDEKEVIDLRLKALNKASFIDLF